MQNKFNHYYSYKHSINNILESLPYNLAHMKALLSPAYLYFVDFRFNKDNDTALMFAADFCDEDVVQDLIARHASLDATNLQGKTALMYAAQQQRWHIVKLLIKAGANELLWDNDGKSALDYVDADKDIFAQTVRAAKGEWHTLRTQRVELLRHQIEHERDAIDDLTEPIESCCTIQ